MSDTKRAISYVRNGCVRGQRGIVLFVGMVFLLMLSIIAIVMMRGTLFEARMATASARHLEAFETSETLRTVPEALLAQHVYSRGWPESWGGDVTDDTFDLPRIFGGNVGWMARLAPSPGTGAGLQSACAKLPVFYEDSACQGVISMPRASDYEPAQWMPTFVLDSCIGGSVNACDKTQTARTRISILRDGSRPTSHEGAAQAQGYTGAGEGAASSSVMVFEIRSATTVPGGGAAETIAQYQVELPEQGE